MKIYAQHLMGVEIAFMNPGNSFQGKITLYGYTECHETCLLEETRL